MSGKGGSPAGYGTVWGVGVGPGDPELMTRKAERLVRQTRHIAYFRKRGRAGRARSIIEGLLRPDAVELAFDYPVTTEIAFDDPAYAATLAPFYENAAAALAGVAETGEDVVVLAEGDPFFYGSFMHLHQRLADRVPVQVVPGVPSMAAAWVASRAPITWGDDVLMVLPATLPEDVLRARAEVADALVFMKVGRNLPKVRAVLAALGRLSGAWLVEFASMPQERVVPLAEAGETAPYFSVVLVHGQGRRP